MAPTHLYYHGQEGGENAECISIKTVCSFCHLHFLCSMRNWKIAMLTIFIPIFLNCLSLLLWRITADSLQDEKLFTFHYNNIGHNLWLVDFP